MFAPHSTRAAPFVKTATGAAVLISCQSEVTAPEPAQKGEAPSYDTVRIWGIVRDNFGQELTDVDVEWWCNTCAEEIGVDAVDDIGRYDIDPPPPFNWDDHDGHDLEGAAYKEGYYCGDQYIYDFDSSAVYRRDFTMYAEE